MSTQALLAEIVKIAESRDTVVFEVIAADLTVFGADIGGRPQQTADVGQIVRQTEF